MDIYKDSIEIAEALGLEPIEFEFNLEEAKKNSTFCFSGADMLIGKVSCVNRQGDILLVDTEVYYNQTDNEYVIHTSKEGFRRRNKPEEERKLPPNKSNFDFTYKKNSLKGDSRTEKQKESAKNHSERMKGTVINKKGEKLSEKHRMALRVPRVGAGKHNNHPSGDEHFARKKIQCPHCGKLGGGGSMKRWHFNNCKNWKLT